MTSRLLATCSLMGAFMCASAAAQTTAPYPPFRAGSTAPVVLRTPANAPQVVPATTATWTKAKTAPPVSVGTTLLLTDGRVLVHSEPNCGGCLGNYSHWYSLTPDNSGSYINGTWKLLASLP